MTRNQTRSSVDDDEDQTVRNLEGSVKLAEADSTMDSQSEERSGTSHEDLFLNLARSDSLMDETAEALSKNERRRVSPGWLMTAWCHVASSVPEFPLFAQSSRHCTAAGNSYFP